MSEHLSYLNLPRAPPHELGNRQLSPAKWRILTSCRTSDSRNLLIVKFGWGQHARVWPHWVWLGFSVIMAPLGCGVLPFCSRSPRLTTRFIPALFPIPGTSNDEKWPPYAHRSHGYLLWEMKL